MKQITPGIPDSQFLRTQVPMTKEEVRTISVCKLHLGQKAVVYDIGSGTGSVAVEIARLSKDIQVFAIETNPDAVELIQKNARKFNLTNIQVVKNLAPEGLSELPPPSHTFIGGTKGRLREILLCLLQKNPEQRVVVNAVTLESISKIHSLLAELSIKDYECLQISVNRAESAGKYHLLKAENPVYIFSFDLAGGEKTL